MYDNKYTCWTPLYRVYRLYWPISWKKSFEYKWNNEGNAHESVKLANLNQIGAFPQFNLNEN